MKTILFFLQVLFVMGCANDNDDFEPKTITPILIAKGGWFDDSQTFTVRQNIIITNGTEWNDFIARMNNTTNAINFTEMNLDFNDFQIIAVVDVLRASGGFSIDITNVVESNTNIVVTIKQLMTGNDSTVMSQPFHIIKIPKSIKPVIFQ